MVNMSLLYPWFKALHVLSALLFFGGVMTVSAFLWSARGSNVDASGIAVTLRRWDQAVTTPAMVLVWTFGLALAITGHWFDMPWLNVKLFLVIVFSAAHGIQSGRLRRFSHGTPSSPWPLLPMIFISIAGIAILAVVKPS